MYDISTQIEDESNQLNFKTICQSYTTINTITAIRINNRILDTESIVYFYKDLLESIKLYTNDFNESI